MEVRFAVLADSANVSREGKLNISGIFSIVNAKTFPAGHAGAWLVIVTEAHPEEAGRHEMRIILADADGNPQLEVTVGFVVPEPEDKSKPVRGNQMLNLPVIPLLSPGDYSFDIFVDGRYEVSVPLTAREV
jgi:hypothetical protein